MRINFCAWLHVIGANSHLVQTLILRPFLVAAGWQELAKATAVAKKRTPIVVWIVKPIMAAARLPLQCYFLALSNQQLCAKKGIISKFE